MRKLLSAIMLFAAATLSAGEKTPALTGVYVELTRDGQDVELFGNVDRFKLSFSDNFPLAETNLMVTWSDIRGRQTFSRGNTFRLRELGDVLRFGWIVSSFDDHERKSNLTNIRLAFGNSAAGRKSSFSQGGRSFPSISRKSRVVLYPGVRTPLCTWDWGNGQKGALSLTLAITAEGLAKIRGVSRDEVILDKWLEKVGVPPDAERKSWNLRELTDYALRGEDVRLRFESGTIGMVEMLDSELGMIKILLRQPGMAASPLEARLRREYLKRLQQQLAMCKAVYEMGTIGPEPVRQKELEISEFRKRHGLSETPPSEWKKSAFAQYRAAAEKGDAAAQFELGCRLGFGWGVEGDNRPEAAKWFEKAAVQGHPTARGACLMFGFGVGKNLEEAEKLFRAEAEKGDAWAQLLLGMCRLEKRDAKEAVEWFRKSALQGNAVAQFHLSERYQFGGGAEKDPAEAEKWMKKSAEQGFEPALRVLDAWKLGKRPPDVEIIKLETAR